MDRTFAINGFGRIGRLAFRIWYLYYRSEIKLAAINTSGSMPLEGWASLLKHDTTYRLFPGNLELEVHQDNHQVSDEDPLLGYFVVDNEIRIPVLAQRDPAKIPWQTYQVNLVIESTGVFRTLDKAKLHLHPHGAKRVLISAPGKSDGIVTLVKGVQETNQGQVFSNASCTTNSIAPVMKVLLQEFGVAKAFLTTVHAYTDNQRLQDGSHKDLRRARAAAQNIVPTTTGAALATTKVLPQLHDFAGLALRVPVITGSLSDITAVLEKSVTKDQLNQAFIKASQTYLKDVLATTDEALVSSDIIGNRHSSIVDLSLTSVVGGNLVKVVAWYDNEWGFTNRLLDMAVYLLTH